MSEKNAGMASLLMELEIAAPVSEVWSALTEDIGAWWPAEFYAGGEESARNFSLETHPGGRMLETWDGGGGVLWGTVVCIDPGVRLQVLGATFPNWGGPTQWFGTWDLSGNGESTTLRFSESAIGRVSDAGTAEKDKGWQFLWACMKAHAEGKPAPAWQD